MSAPANHFFYAAAAALLVACGGTDPLEATDRPAHAASNASSQADAGTKALAIHAAQSQAIVAGAAATQDEIDRAIAAHAAARSQR